MNHKVIYISSYDRGLETLLNMWPSIREQVPDATLDIFYGFNSFDAVHKQNPDMMKWKWTMIRKLHELKSEGVTEHGRVSHTELAQELKKHKVWAYPTSFTEIHCISALKAQEAGCIPVTTGCYALAETVVNNKYTVRCDDIDTNIEKQKEFTDAVVKALLDNETVVKPVPNVSWEAVAEQWHKVISR